VGGKTPPLGKKKNVGKIEETGQKDKCRKVVEYGGCTASAILLGVEKAKGLWLLVGGFQAKPRGGSRTVRVKGVPQS